MTKSNKTKVVDNENIDTTTQATDEVATQENPETSENQTVENTEEKKEETKEEKKEEKKETPKKEEKKDNKSKEKVFEDDDEPTNNYTLLWNRYVKAIDDLKAIVEGDKDFYNATEWKFKYVAVGGSIKFLSNGKYVKVDLKNPYITVNDKKTAEIVVRSKRFKIVSYK